MQAGQTGWGVIFVDEAIRKAGVLIEALSWIRRFRDRYVVIKMGGSVLEEPEAVKQFLTDVLFMETVGMRPVLIHGGGKDISRAMEQAGIRPVWVQGRRYTDEATLDIAARVLAEDICGRLVNELNRQGGQATGLSYLTENVLLGRKLSLKSETGGELDLGWVGEVDRINRSVLDRVTSARTIPVLPCIALDDSGHRLNVNGDTAAAAVARLLKAEKLVFVSDVPGIFLDRNDPASLVRHLDSPRCRELIRTGVISAGMVPKVEAALEALDAGVGKIHIVDGRMPHSVLLEIYSDTGIGTEIVR